jgi:hypothetical protein
MNLSSQLSVKTPGLRFSKRPGFKTTIKEAQMMCWEMGKRTLVPWDTDIREALIRMVNKVGVSWR